ncbi:hypothetical protein C8R45DRAFT_1176878 [Mycena sanguinolenta]|nr:hypothetical protein C8R45DRAFT_1176878 [Mycena sanguinolenta]
MRGAPLLVLRRIKMCDLTAERSSHPVRVGPLRPSFWRVLLPPHSARRRGPTHYACSLRRPHTILGRSLNNNRSRARALLFVERFVPQIITCVKDRSNCDTDVIPWHRPRRCLALAAFRWETSRHLCDSPTAMLTYLDLQQFVFNQQWQHLENASAAVSSIHACAHGTADHRDLLMMSPCPPSRSTVGDTLPIPQGVVLKMPGLRDAQPRAHMASLALSLQ